MSLVSKTRSRSFFLRQLQAARGQNAPTESRHLINNVTNSSNPGNQILKPLPCFPLHPDHIRTIPSIDSESPSLLDSSVTLPSPEDFHAHLCKSILNAKRRVKLATLYIGAGNGCMSISTDESSHSFNPPREEELLKCLRQLSTLNMNNQKENGNDAGNNKDAIEIKILMDASRALRPIRVVRDSKLKEKSTTSTTSSAKEVFYSLFPNGVKDSDQTKNGVSLFNVHSGLRASLPSPLNEILGVFHLKVYIIDDELILSGANLSEEYFKDRLDRYMSFVEGANGLVDFYSDLIDVLADHSTKYDPSSSDSSNGARSELNEASLSNALSKLFDGSNSLVPSDNPGTNSCVEEAFAYAVPTFQPSQSFLERNTLSFPQDIEVIRNLLFSTWDCFSNSKVHLSSAYLNPTPLFMSALGKYGSKKTDNPTTDQVDKERENGAAFLLSAAPSSHGFKQKNKDDAVNGSGRGWVPSVYLKLAEEVNAKFSHGGGKLLLYERDGFTFHAKGIWLTSGTGSKVLKQSSINNLQEKCKISEPENNLIATVVGSSNFGSRSEIIDFESNCILVMNPHIKNEKATNVKRAIAGEWNSMLNYCVELGSRPDLKIDKATDMIGFVRDAALQVVRKFF